MKKRKSYKSYPREFKIRIAKEALKSKNIVQYSKEIEFNISTIYRWKKEVELYGKDAFLKKKTVYDPRNIRFYVSFTSREYLYIADKYFEGNFNGEGKAEILRKVILSKEAIIRGTDQELKNELKKTYLAMSNLANNINQIAKRLNWHEQAGESDIEQLWLTQIDLNKLIQDTKKLYKEI